MAFLVIPDSDERALSSEKAGDYAETASWKVLVDTASPSLAAIHAAVGVYVGSAGPSGTVCKQVRVRGGEDRYVYRVTAEYSRLEKNDNPLTEPDKFSWSTSLNTTKPFLTALGKPSDTTKSVPDGTSWCIPCVNSAEDPLETIMGEIAEARLRIVGNRASFLPSMAMNYVGSVNLNAYAGGAPYTWKCISIEASEQETRVDDGTGSGNSIKLLYWQVNVELAYRAEGWAVEAFDVGWNELVPVPGSTSYKSRKITVPRVEKLPKWSTASDDDKALMVEQYSAHDPQALYSYESPIPSDVAKAGQAKPEGQAPDIIRLYLNPAKNWSGVFPSPPTS